jgi:flagellar hook-length control protein FliK
MEARRRRGMAFAKPGVRVCGSRSNLYTMQLALLDSVMGGALDTARGKNVASSSMLDGSQELMGSGSAHKAGRHRTESKRGRRSIGPEFECCLTTMTQSDSHASINARPAAEHREQSPGNRTVSERRVAATDRAAASARRREPSSDERETRLRPEATSDDAGERAAIQIEPDSSPVDPASAGASPDDGSATPNPSASILNGPPPLLHSDLDVTGESGSGESAQAAHDAQAISDALLQANSDAEADAVQNQLLIRAANQSRAEAANSSQADATNVSTLDAAETAATVDSTRANGSTVGTGRNPALRGRTSTKASVTGEADGRQPATGAAVHDSAGTGTSAMDSFDRLMTPLQPVAQGEKSSEVESFGAAPPHKIEGAREAKAAPDATESNLRTANVEATATRELVGSGTRQQARTVHQVAQEIVSRADVAVREGRTEFSMRLDPPELGTVRVHLTATGHSLSARVLVANEAVQQLVSAHLDSLRQSLADAGMSLQRFDVSHGGHGNTNGQAHQELWRSAPERDGWKASRTTPARGTTGPASRGRIDVIV